MSWIRRREFLRWSAGAIGAIGLAACQSTAPTAAPAAQPTTPPAAPPTAASTVAAAAAPQPTTASATVAPAAAKPTTAPAPGSGGTLIYGLSGDLDDTLDPQVTN